MYGCKKIMASCMRLTERGRFGNWRTATTRIPSVGSEFPVYRRLLERYKETPAQSLIVRVFVILYALRCGERGNGILFVSGNLSGGYSNLLGTVYMDIQ